MPPDQWIVTPGYERVRDAFVRSTGTFGRGGGAYAAYVDGELVVDLWDGQARPGQAWEAGTTTVLMSATKGLTALCLQILADRGQLDIGERVATYWPEFAQNGKQNVLVRHVLTHTAGLLGFTGQTDLMRPDGAGWDDYDAISAGFAAQAPEWEPGTKHGYHALSFGWLAAEIVRRITGRSLGTFFHEEVAIPLGLEAWIGTPTEELGRVAHVYSSDMSTLPRFVRKGFEAAELVARDPATLTGKAFLGTGSSSAYEALEALFNNPRVLQAEFPAGGATATARALATVWAAAANGGELNGVRIVSEACTEEFSRVALCEPDLLMSEIPIPRLLGRASAPVTRTLGYLGNGPMPGLGHRFGPNPAAYGVEGLGGQYGFCDPAGRIAVGSVRSDLAIMEVLQPTVTNALYDCARHLGHSVFTPPPRSWAKALAHGATGALVRRKMAVRS